MKWAQNEFGSLELELGSIRLLITDQRDRDCGWVWHASVDTISGGDTIEQRGRFQSAEDAQEAAVTWLREFCRRALVALEPAEILASAEPAEISAGGHGSAGSVPPSNFDEVFAATETSLMTALEGDAAHCGIADYILPDGPLAPLRRAL